MPGAPEAGVVAAVAVEIAEQRQVRAWRPKAADREVALTAMGATKPH
jgi:hypothetical protein